MPSEPYVIALEEQYVDNLPGMPWMQTVPLSAADKEKMFNANARSLLKL